MTNSTTIPFWRILLSVIVFGSVHWTVDAIDIILQNEIISYTLAMHTSTLILALLNMDVLELHAKRLKGHLDDALLFIFLAALLCYGASTLAYHWLNVRMVTLNLAEVAAYSFFTITFMLAYSFAWSFSFVIAFKAVTDRFKLHLNEKMIILCSGLLFGAITTAAHCSVYTIEAIAPLFAYFFLISTITSYTYNQTNSIFPMAIGYGIALLLINLL